MAYKPEVPKEKSNPCKGLSFIDWDELGPEEFSKLNKIINTSTDCTAVQFPFAQETQALDKSGDAEEQHVRAGEPPLFQPNIPPPSVVRFPIPVHHWTHGDPNLAAPVGSPYPITVHSGYMFQAPALAAAGGVTVAYVTSLSHNQPVYGIPSLPGHPIHSHFPGNQLPPNHHGEVVAQPVHQSGGPMLPPSPTHPQPVVLTHMTHDGQNITAPPAHVISPVTMSHGIPLTQAAQVVYIPQAPVVPSESQSDSPSNEQQDAKSKGSAISGLAPSSISSTIEFGGPVIFNDVQPKEKTSKLSVSKTDRPRVDEVVIDMTAVQSSKSSDEHSGLDKTSGIVVEKESNSIDTVVHNNLSNISVKEDSNSVSVSKSDEEVPLVEAVPSTPTNAITAPQLSPANPPIKMWSSLFGSSSENKSNSTKVNSVQSNSVASPTFPPVSSAQDVKGVRYWQEQEKQIDLMKTISTEKITPVGPQNDPIAPMVLEHLDKLPVTHTPILIQPRGLKNGNNICFMNAPLQVLMGCPPFVHLFRAFKKLPQRQGSASSTPVFDSLVQFVNSFQDGHRMRNQGSRNKKGSSSDVNIGQAFSPDPLLNVAQNVLGLHIGVQHDAEEFLSRILSICHEELENVLKLNDSNGLNNNNDTKGEKKSQPNGYLDNGRHVEGFEDEDESDEAWQQVGPKNHSVETNVNDCGQTPLSSIFAGLSRSCLIKESGKTSDTLDSFFTLKLDIQAEGVLSVKEALLRLNTTETVHDADGRKIHGQRRMFFDILPPVLIMHLKLFEYSNGNGQKIQKKIAFDVDLNIPKEILSRVGKSKYASNKARSYKLFGVVNHHGTKMNDGHYTSDVFLAVAAGWLRFDDCEVTAIQESHVLQYHERSMPYLLFYRRMDLS